MQFADVPSARLTGGGIHRKLMAMIDTSILRGLPRAGADAPQDNNKRRS
jgi:hypothetical protein